MGRYFNVAGPCIPGKHYMIEATRRLEEIERLIDGEHILLSMQRARAEKPRFCSTS